MPNKVQNEFFLKKGQKKSACLTFFMQHPHTFPLSGKLTFLKSNFHSRTVLSLLFPEYVDIALIYGPNAPRKQTAI